MSPIFFPWPLRYQGEPVTPIQRLPASLSFSVKWEDLEKSLTAVVYGSNLIESAGSSHQVTAELCRTVFRSPSGDAVKSYIYEDDPSYKDHTRALIATNREPTKQNVNLSRKEVIRHAVALKYVIDRIVVEGREWSADLILKAHSILYNGLSENVAAGKYRDHEVAVMYSKPGEEKPKKSICLRATAVPTYMTEMITELNKEIKKGNFDPYTLAARYHNQFVLIHPFADGNGRMTRIIMNVLLLKYAGHVTPLGSTQQEKEEYLTIVRQAHKVFHVEDQEVEFEKQSSHLEFARFLRAKSGR